MHAATEVSFRSDAGSPALPAWLEGFLFELADRLHGTKVTVEVVPTEASGVASDAGLTRLKISYPTMTSLSIQKEQQTPADLLSIAPERFYEIFPFREYTGSGLSRA